MSLFKGHVACPNLTPTGLRVNFSDSLIKGKEFSFELAGKVIRVRVIGVLLYKKTMMHALLTKREVNIIAGYC